MRTQDFACSFAEGLRKGQQMKLERENAQAQQELMKAKGAAIRAETERVKQADAVTAAPVATPAPAQQWSPGTALANMPEFHQLPMAIRIKFIRP